MKAYYEAKDVRRVYEDVKEKVYRNTNICVDTKETLEMLRNKIDSLCPVVLDDGMKFDEIAVGNAFLYAGKTYLKINLGVDYFQVGSAAAALLLPECKVRYSFPDGEKMEPLTVKYEFLPFDED